MLKVLLLCLVLGALWYVRQEPKTDPKPVGQFERTPVSMDFKPGEVLIFTPRSCSKEGQARAQKLVEGLRTKAVSVRQTVDLKFGIASNEQAVNKMMTLLNGEPPVVFINGKVMSNPSLELILAELKPLA